MKSALLIIGCLLTIQDPPPDLAALLTKADQILSDSKAAYEEARSKSLPSAFVDAGFKLEEARIKYLVLQEIGNAAQQKTAADRLRVVQQLTKLIHDGKVAITSGPAVTSAPVAPAAPVPPPKDAPADAPTADAAAKSDVLARPGIPPAAALKESEKLLKDLFKEQYAKKSSADRQALARALLAQAAKTTGDPASSYVLYREAIDAAVQGGDPVVALFAVDEQARFFDVDLVALRSDTLAALSKNAKTPQESYTLCEAYLKLTEEYVAADQYDQADKAMSLATTHAKKANAPPLIQRVATRSKEIAESKSRFSAIKEHLSTLAKNPEHPGANLEMGQYLCFVKGSWDLGLRFLALGSDAGLKSLAQKEATTPTQPAEIAELADGWALLSEKEKSALKKGQMIAHARGLYEAALPDAMGLLKAKIEKRLDTMVPPMPSGPIDLLVLIDPAKDAVAGAWRFEAGVLVSDSAGYSRLQIPFLPPEEYDLTVTCQRGEEDGSLGFGLVYKESQFAIVYDTWAPSCKYGIDAISTVDAWMNETTGQGRQLNTGKPATFEFRVRKTGVTTLVDGKTLIRWTGDYAKLKVSWRWPMPNTKLPFLGHDKGVLSYSKVVLTPVTGQGRRLR